MPRARCVTLAIGILVLSGTACVVEEPVDDLETGQQEITGGVDTPAGVHAAVGYLTPNTGVPCSPPQSRAGNCSGTLIADNLVLTAAHCVCRAPLPGQGCPNMGARFFSLTEVDDFTTPQNEATTPNACVTFSGTPVVHPDYEAGGWYENDGLVDNDYAVIVLNQNVSSRVNVAPLSISTAYPSLAYPPDVLTLVGFGGAETISYPECDPLPFGIKRHAATQLDGLSDRGKYGYDLDFSDAQIHVCGGDSGGPAIDSQGRIAGVASVGDREDFSRYDGTYKAREWIQMQINSAANRHWIWGFGATPAQRLYVDANRDVNMFGWHDPEDHRLVGDFRNLGYDQVLYINRGSGTGRFFVTDLSDQVSPVESQFWASYSQSTLYAEFLNSTADRQLVGDFLGLGYDQVMFINTGGSGGRIRIADFSLSTSTPASVYFESYTQSVLLNGWHDGSGTTLDKTLVGDFRANGHDQVMFINRGAGAGRVLIVDFGPGHPSPAEWGADVPYYEAYSQSVTLNGWHDGNNDFIVAGDFMQQSFDQVLFANGDGAGGRMMIVDFRGAAPTDWPSDIWYYEGYGWSTMFNFWQDADDALLAGDFTGEGFDQLLLVNRGPVGRFLVADFRGGYPADQRFIQFQGQDPRLEGRIDGDDGLLVGDFGNFVAQPIEQLLTIERF